MALELLELAYREKLRKEAQRQAVLEAMGLGGLEALAGVDSGPFGLGVLPKIRTRDPSARAARGALQLEKMQLVGDLAGLDPDALAAARQVAAQRRGRPAPPAPAHEEPLLPAPPPRRAPAPRQVGAESSDELMARIQSGERKRHDPRIG